ncbi:MAG: cupin domain-containing protein [Ignavibacteriaceae bacterium]|nr:cupin domain-containing protein [Ignavibacteriaceae bacterium]
MLEQIKEIAERVKGLREVSGISAETLAKELDLTTEQYLLYESGTVDIPAGFLIKIAQINNMELSALLTGENPRLHIYSVVRKDKGLNVERRKQYKYEHLAYNFINKKAEPFIVRVEPGTDDVPLEYNSHPGQEFDYVIEGTMKIVIDNHEIILNEGDSVYYDSGYKHAMKALNNVTVKMLTVVL